MIRVGHLSRLYTRPVLNIDNKFKKKQNIINGAIVKTQEINNLLNNLWECLMKRLTKKCTLEATQVACEWRNPPGEN